jgi:hypothetical protein
MNLTQYWVVTLEGSHFTSNKEGLYSGSHIYYKNKRVSLFLSIRIRLLQTQWITTSKDKRQQEPTPTKTNGRELDNNL